MRLIKSDHISMARNFKNMEKNNMDEALDIVREIEKIYTLEEVMLLKDPLIAEFVKEIIEKEES